MAQIIVCEICRPPNFGSHAQKMACYFSIMVRTPRDEPQNRNPRLTYYIYLHRLTRKMLITESER